MKPSRQIAVPLLAAVSVWATLSLSAQPLAPTESAPAATRGSGGEDPCPDCVILDDGSAETGYGWVPSVVEGEYVQRIHTSLFPTRDLDSVCICWLRTQADSTIDFEVIFYEDIDGVPAPSPYAAVPASASIDPIGVTETFVEVDVSGVRLPVGPSYVGARWDPSVDSFFFICTDTSEDTPPVNVFFRDDRSEGGLWTSVFESADPIFSAHRSIMLRVCSSLETAIDIPAVGAGGLVILLLLVAGLGVRALARGRRGE